MNYEFPIIERIEDVLPAIEGRDEFIVAEREGYKVINYNVGYEDTFTIDENDVMENYGRLIPKGVMRRECRGIIFFPDGKLMSRPFEKFFNVGEREETQLHALDMTQPHVIMEKMDGSMIRPLLINGEIRLGTKMGITDTSIAAEKWLQSHSRKNDLYKWLFIAIGQKLTPLFEFISPNNRIVIEYTHTDLVLLALRDNQTGKYLSIDKNEGYHNDWSVVQTYGSVEDSFDEYIARQRGLEGREGDIIMFATGHKLKIKNDWYVRIHKVKDKIRTDRHILALVLENEIDDVMPHLDENDFERVRKFEADFHAAYHAKLEWLDQFAEDMITDAEGDRKRLATEALPESGVDKSIWRFVFGMADGKDMNEMLMAHVRSKLGNTTKYNELAEFLGLESDQGELE